MQLLKENGRPYYTIPYPIAAIFTSLNQSLPSSYLSLIDSVTLDGEGNLTFELLCRSREHSMVSSYIENAYYLSESSNDFKLIITDPIWD